VDDVVDMAVVDLAELDGPERAELSQLLSRAGKSDDHSPLPEPQLRAVSGPREAGTVGRAVLARGADGLAGGAFLSPLHDGSVALHVVIDPTARGGERGPALASALTSALVRRAVPEAPPRAPIHLWAMRAGPADDDLARALGFAAERDLLQMRVPLPLADEIVEATRPLATRPFEPGRDEEAWVQTNNRAFAGHPEQGGWTVEQLRARMAAGWVELDGFLVADDPDGAGFIGSCWTKIHRDHTPALGEIYVIAVDPRYHGQGWGRSLTVAGLESLARRRITVGMLYTDATNEAAVVLYRSLGFTVDHVDRSYRRDPSGST
jgi:mycothiol synthase